MTARSFPFRRTALPGVLWVLAGIAWLTDEALAAAAFPGYSYATNYISDLGVPEVGGFQGRAIDSPLHVLMNVTFIGQGVLFAVAGVLAARAVGDAARRTARTVAIVAVVHGVGLTLVGVFHGSQASVENGTGVLHVIGAAAAIIGGNVVAIVAGVGSGRVGAFRGYRLASVLLGIVGLVSLVMLLVDSASSAVTVLPDGVWERASVYTVIGWELLTGVLVLSRLVQRHGIGPRVAAVDA